MSETLQLIGAGQGRRKLGEFWCEARDADPAIKEIFDRHYSRRHYADGRRQVFFVGPGEKMVLVTEDGKAIFIWRKFISLNKQDGVNCAVFRNEGEIMSSLLILDAETAARKRWPGQRFYTYVNSLKIRSKNPGCCFKKAGWRVCGKTKIANLIVLEKLPVVTG